jgi:hypothetical protein
MIPVSQRDLRVDRAPCELEGSLFPAEQTEVLPAVSMDISKPGWAPLLPCWAPSRPHHMSCLGTNPADGKAFAVLGTSHLVIIFCFFFFFFFLISKALGHCQVTGILQNSSLLLTVVLRARSETLVPFYGWGVQKCFSHHRRRGVMAKIQVRLTLKSGIIPQTTQAEHPQVS